MKYRSKQEFLESIEKEHRTFLELADSIPEERYDEIGVWGDGWTIKDLFAHLTEWQRMFRRWFEAGLAGETPEMPAPGYKWNETPRLNHDIWKRCRHEPWEEVRRDFATSHQELLALATRLSEEELLTPGYFPWTRKYPLTTYLGPSTASHYRSSTKILKRWLRGAIRKPSSD